jgi:gag-polyprotein putative aspartyl protease
MISGASSVRATCETADACARSAGATVAGPGPKWTIKTANDESVASPVTLDAVSFGGLYMKDVQALILAPEAGEANLLGASFLNPPPAQPDVISPNGSQLSPLNEASCNRRMGLKLSGEVSIVMPGNSMGG